MSEQSTRDMKLVAVILINFNNHEDTIECLDSLLRSAYQPYMVVVIDNASRDDPRAEFATWCSGGYASGHYRGIPGQEPEPGLARPIPFRSFYFDGQGFSESSAGRGLPSASTKGTQCTCEFPVQFVRLHENLGFSGANNLGVRFCLTQHAPGYFWFLNNDTVVAPEALRCLVQTADSDGRIGAVGSKILSYACPDRLQFLGGGGIGIGYNLAPHDGKKDFPAPQGQLHGYITGSSFFLKASVREAVGDWDEDFFMSVEDIEYSMRIRKAGYRLSFSPGSIVYHKGGASTLARKITRTFLGIQKQRYPFESCAYVCYYNLRNWVYLNRTHRGVFFNLVYSFVFLPYYFLGIVFFILVLDDHKVRRITLVARAFRDGLTGTMGRNARVERLCGFVGP